MRNASSCLRPVAPVLFLLTLPTLAGCSGARGEATGDTTGAETAAIAVTPYDPGFDAPACSGGVPTTAIDPLKGVFTGTVGEFHFAVRLQLCYGTECTAWSDGVLAPTISGGTQAIDFVGGDVPGGVPYGTGGPSSFILAWWTDFPASGPIVATLANNVESFALDGPASAPLQYAASAPPFTAAFGATVNIDPGGSAPSVLNASVSYVSGAAGSPTTNYTGQFTVEQREVQFAGGTSADCLRYVSVGTPYAGTDGMGNTYTVAVEVGIFGSFNGPDAGAPASGPDAGSPATSSNGGDAGAPSADAATQPHPALDAGAAPVADAASPPTQDASTAGGCYSPTLMKQMPNNACVQDDTNQLWYQCDGGTWVDRWTDPTACDGVFPL